MTINGHDNDDKKKLVQEMFSPARIALQKEVNRHPPLVQMLTLIDKSDWPAQIGEIAAYCFVVVDGMYMPSELDKLADILYWKLKEKHVIRLQ